VRLRVSQIADPFLLHLAAHKALAAQAAGRLTTRTLHSELVFNTSPTNHVRPLASACTAAARAEPSVRRSRTRCAALE
jgi:hypothetical protein